MALKKTDQIENFIANAAPELEAKDFESIMVKDIVLAGAAGKYVTIKIGGTTCGYLRYDNATLGNHLAPQVDGRETLLAFLAKQKDEEGKPIFKGYPIASGQKMVLSEAGGGNLTGYILYDTYDDTDITSEMPNGELSKERMIISYGRCAADITTAAATLIDTLVNPKEYPGIPFGKPVPSKTKAILYGLCASERAKSGATNGATNNIRTTYLEIMDGFKTLFDKDKEGILAHGSIPSEATTFEAEKGTSPLGEGTELHNTRRPHMFEKPIELGPGHELNVSWKTELSAGASTLTKAESEIAAIYKYLKEQK